MQNELKFFPLEKTSETIRPMGYKVLDLPLNPVKRWVANLLWSWLFKLGALGPYLHHTVYFRYGKEQREKIAELIHQQVYSIIRRGHEPEAYCLIVGGKEFAEIMKGVADLGQFMIVPSGTTYYQIPGGYRGEVRGFPVHVVNDFSGVALLPRVMVEKVWQPERKPFTY